MNRFQTLLSISTCAPKARHHRRAPGGGERRVHYPRLGFLVGTTGHCSPLHRMSFIARNQGSNAADDVASSSRQSCPYVVVHFVGAGHCGVRRRRVARHGLRRNDAGGVPRSPQRTGTGGPGAGCGGPPGVGPHQARAHYTRPLFTSTCAVFCYSETPPSVSHEKC